MKGTYTVQGPTDKFVDFVTNNFEDCNVLMQKPGDHVIEITVFDYEMNSYDGCVGVSDYFEPNKTHKTQLSYNTGRQHGQNICDKHGKSTAKKVVRYKPRNDYEKGKIDCCKEFLSKQLEAQIEAH